MKFTRLIFLGYLIILTFFNISCEKKVRKIPIISKELSLRSKQIDSLKFTDQFNRDFKISSLKGELHLVNFFFTSCTTICPLMEVPLTELSTKHSEIKFLSFSIDPERDSVPVLKQYYDQINLSNRTFLTCSKKDLAKIATYYLSPMDGEDIENLYHTSTIVLLDEKMQIRGLYDALNTEDIEFLEADISQLSKK